MVNGLGLLVMAVEPVGCVSEAGNSYGQGLNLIVTDRTAAAN